MRIVSSNVKGKESVKYYFTQREKDLLRGYIPVNPCLKCPNNISCVGCPSSREYFSKMTQLFGDDPNLIRPGMVLHLPSAGGSKPVLRVGSKVRYSGRLYGDSYGGNPGKTVDGTYTVTRITNGRKAGVLLDQVGWAPADRLSVLS